jgi:hypothetical protein
MQTKPLAAKTKKAPLMKEEPSGVLPTQVSHPPLLINGAKVDMAGWYGTWVRREASKPSAS